MGRKKLPDQRRRTKQLGVRLTEGELRSLVEQSGGNHRGLSSWIRHVLCEETVMILHCQYNLQAAMQARADELGVPLSDWAIPILRRALSAERPGLLPK